MNMKRTKMGYKKEIRENTIDMLEAIIENIKNKDVMVEDVVVSTKNLDAIDCDGDKLIPHLIKTTIVVDNTKLIKKFCKEIRSESEEEDTFRTHR